MPELEARKVFIVSPDAAYIRMFTERGWIMVDNVKNADLVQFTGGEDVTPALYGEGPHRTTFNSVNRDMREQLIFRLAKANGVPMAGICRGGQFLNVMCGGSMWQDVDSHCGQHDILDLSTLKVFKATSTHHQMMRVGEGGHILAVASEAYHKERMVYFEGADGDWSIMSRSCTPYMDMLQMPKGVNVAEDMDTEEVYYHSENALCFQPHPEFLGEDKLADIYFEYLDNYCFLIPPTDIDDNIPF